MSMMLSFLLAKNWAIGYVIVAVGVILGLAMALRPSSRKLAEISPNFKKRR